LSSHDPFVKPNKTIGIFYNRISPSKKQPTIFTLEPLLIVLFSPLNNQGALAAPARFFLAVFINEKRKLKRLSISFAQTRASTGRVKVFTNYFWLLNLLFTWYIV